RSRRLGIGVRRRNRPEGKLAIYLRAGGNRGRAAPIVDGNNGLARERAGVEDAPLCGDDGGPRRIGGESRPIVELRVAVQVLRNGNVEWRSRAGIEVGAQVNALVQQRRTDVEKELMADVLVAAAPIGADVVAVRRKAAVGIGVAMAILIEAVDAEFVLRAEVDTHREPVRALYTGRFILVDILRAAVWAQSARRIGRVVSARQRSIDIARQQRVNYAVVEVVHGEASMGSERMIDADAAHNAILRAKVRADAIDGRRALRSEGREVGVSRRRGNDILLL